MTDAKFNDLSDQGSEVIRTDRSYTVTITSNGNKTHLKFDTKLDQALGKLSDCIGLALKNGCKWYSETWTTDEAGKRKLVRTEANDPGTHPKLQ